MSRHPGVGQMRRRGYLASLLVGLIVTAGLVPATHVAHAAVTSGAITVGDLTVVEGDAGGTIVRIPITLKTPAAAPVTVTYAVLGGTATAKKDFKAAKKGKAKFKVGEFSQLATITVIGDALVEGAETAGIWITKATGAPIADGVGVLTMTDNDANGVSAVPEVTAGRPTVWEGNAGNRSALVPVRLSRPSLAAIIVGFNDGCGIQNVKFAPGQLEKQVSVAVPVNASANPTYTIPNTITLSGGFAAVPTAAGAVTVRDDDGLGSSQAVGSTVRASETSLSREALYPALGCDPALGRSDGPSISANGRYVAFQSDAYNLVPFDTNNRLDVFVKDLWTGTIERVSVSSSRVQGNGHSEGPRISPDGRFVLFQSQASNLVAGDPTWWAEAFIHDRLTHTTNLIVPYSATEGRSSFDASISADNRYVLFSSDLDLAGDTDAGEVCPPNPTCGLQDLFILDRTTGTYTAVTTGQNGSPPMGARSAISANGASVTYVAPYGPSENGSSAFVTDWQTNVTELISVNSAEQPLQGWGLAAARPVISADGRKIAFVAEACNLGALCLNGLDSRTSMQVYLRDRNSGLTTVESTNGPSPSVFIKTVTHIGLSANARYVSFATNDPVVIPGWNARCGTEVVQKDRWTGTRVRVSASRAGGCPTGSTDMFPQNVTSSADGSFVAFDSEARDIVGRDGGIDADVFVTRLR